MYGRDETAEQLLLEAMAVADGSVARWRAEIDGLRSSGAFAPTGVRGAYGHLLPEGSLRDAAASAYAEIAHRCGWLDLDRALTKGEYRELAAGVGGWVADDRTLSEVVGAFGIPSLWIGGTNPDRSKTLCYTTADPEDDLISVHLGADVGAASASPPEPVVLAVRHRAGNFRDSFSFTPEGLRQRSIAERQTPVRPPVWIFHGDQARHAAAVFETQTEGLAWAARRLVTGVLAEYPYGGAYDAAVERGRFTPSKPHHGTAAHVASFGPGLQHVHLTDGRPD